MRNLNKIIIGEYEIEPSYFSPYPIELTELDQIYIDDFLHYSTFVAKKQFERYREKCTLDTLLGTRYTRDDYVWRF